LRRPGIDDGERIVFEVFEEVISRRKEVSERQTKKGMRKTSFKEEGS